MTEITTIYKGFTIRFEEAHESWVWENRNSPSLQTIKRAIDAAVRTALKGVEAYYLRRNNELATCEVVSVDDQGSWRIRNTPGETVWATNAVLYGPTPDNLNALTHVAVLEAKLDIHIAAVKAEIKAQLDTLTPLTLDAAMDISREKHLAKARKNLAKMTDGEIADELGQTRVPKGWDSTD